MARMSGVAARALAVLRTTCVHDQVSLQPQLPALQKLPDSSISIARVSPCHELLKE